MSTPTTLSAQRRRRRYIGMLVVVVLMAVGWSALWKYTADKTEQTIAGWLAREAQAGRTYTCGSQTVGGYPFRIEVLCQPASAVLRSTVPPLEFKTGKVHVAAQIYQPDLLISEFAGPFTIGAPGQPPSMIANWSLAQSSVRGTPEAPERVSLVFDNPILDQANPAQPMLRAQHIELHGRLAGGSVNRNPVLDLAVRLDDASVPAAGPLAVQPIDADIAMRLTGLKDFAPKSWAARFREIQAAGGQIEITQARVEQGETLAIGSGTLTLNANGRLEGQLNLAVAGLESFINAVGAATRQQTGFGFTIGLGLLGGNAKVEGRPAIALPLRFHDGGMFFGPIKIGDAPALF
jgi:hypothetical protein